MYEQEEDYPEPEVPDYETSPESVVTATPTLLHELEEASPLSSGIEKQYRRPPVWQSVGNVSGQAVTFKGSFLFEYVPICFGGNFKKPVQYSVAEPIKRGAFVGIELGELKLAKRI